MFSAVYFVSKYDPNILKLTLSVVLGFFHLKFDT